MSKDIRSYFTTISKAKKHALNSDSDDDDNKKKKPNIPSKKPKPNSPQKTKKNKDNENLKPTKISEAFSNKPIKQSKVAPVIKKEETKKKGKQKVKKRIANIDDLDDDETNNALVELNDSIISEEDDKSENKNSSDNKKNIEKNKNSIDNKVLDKKDSGIHDDDDDDGDDLNNDDLNDGKKTKKRSRSKSSNTKTSPTKKQKFETADSGIDPDQERFEKKRYTAALYQKYLNRGTPKNQGNKEYPEGKPNCLENLCFIKTGVLDSLDSITLDELVKKYGGRTVKSVSKKVDYIIVGDDPGPAKIDKAKSLNIPNISEDEFLDMILEKSGMKPKYCKTNDKSKDTEIKSKEKVIKTKEKSPVTSAGTIKIKEPKINEKPEESIKMSTSKPIDESNLSLCDKYRPRFLTKIIGQQEMNSPLNKLKNWLSNWHDNQKPEKKKTILRPYPGMKHDDGAYYKCALLSGSPGIGKTTTAILVSKTLGFDIVEFNASDTRNKKLLHEEVSQLLKNKSISSYAYGSANIDKQRILIMDEVDGMAGNEDRGGIQELINLIKSSSIPIICICNDRQHLKIRSLVNYCFDLPFTKPKMEQIRGALMTVCCRENINMSPQNLKELIIGTGCDIRQTLNHLSIIKSSNQDMSIEDAKKEADNAKKDPVLGNWEVCRMVFTKSHQNNMNIHEKFRLFFHDYSLGPLFVQENYLNVRPNDAKTKVQHLRRLSLAADAISYGDIIDKKIRSTNNWSLLDFEALYLSVLPGYYMSGEVSRLNFPSWLGNNSKKNKIQRICNDIFSHARVNVSGNCLAFLLDYIVPLRNSILLPMKNEKKDGIRQSVDLMKIYHLHREDLDALIEINLNSEKFIIDTKTKSAFTRLYYKEVNLVSHSVKNKKKSTKGFDDNDDLLDEENAIQSDENNDDEDDNIQNDVLIKVKSSSNKSKQKSSNISSNSTKTSKSKSNASSSTTKNTKKGKK